MSGPALHVPVGPMLKYDTVVAGTYRVFVLASVDNACSADAAATSPPEHAPSLAWALSQQRHAPFDPSAARVARPTRLHRYTGPAGDVTFWRFLLEVPMAHAQTFCTYQLAPGHVAPKPDQRPDSVDPTQPYTFTVPGAQQNFHWAAYSCNGFSLSVNPDDFNGPSPLWEDLLRKHEENPFHICNGGGDQSAYLSPSHTRFSHPCRPVADSARALATAVYCDRMVREPELQAWHASKNAAERGAMPLTNEIVVGLDRFWISWYTEWFSTGAFSRAIAQIPMLNMTDDHDLIDGFGTYTDDWSMTPIFNHIGTRGYWWYLLFQQFIVDQVDGTDEATHSNKSIIFGASEASFIKGSRGHSFLAYLGPEQYLLMLDCRAERKVEQVCTEATYHKVLTYLYRLPKSVKHLVVLLGVPLAYPRMVFVEKILSNSHNPLVMLAKTFSPGFTNSFDERPELLDDLGDHWCAAPHKRERNWLVDSLQKLAVARGFRVSFVSGDVHAGGAGVFYGYTHQDPVRDPKYMLALITSAIVNTPPPAALITILNKLAARKHRSLFYIGTKETMLGMFEEGLDGQKQNDKYIIGARNWCDVRLDDASGALVFDLRVEKARGAGDTKSYTVQTPAPGWQPTGDVPSFPSHEHHPIASTIAHVASAEHHMTGTAHPSLPNP